MIVNKYKYGGGGSGSGSTYTAGEYIQISEDVISVTGITPDLYLTTADTQDFATEADITAATSPIQEQLDDVERVTATALTELHDAIVELSGLTEDFATETYVDDAIQEAISGLSPDLPSYLDQEVLEAKEEVIASAITELHNQVIEISGSTPDLSNYYTSAQTEDAISAATSGKADAANVTPNDFMRFPKWNAQGIITGTTGNNLSTTGFYLNGTRRTLIKEQTSGDLGDLYAPTTPGTAGNILVSNGSGAPVWTTDNKVSSTSVSTIWKGTQAQYDALATKDPSTFYIIVE